MTHAPRDPRQIKGISFELFEPVTFDAPEPLVVQYLVGTGSRLVVSFAGVGLSRGVTPPREFTSSASNGGENHVLFISDRSRSWMNGPGVANAVMQIVKRMVEFHGISEVVALGNSMGGFSAITLADLMPVRTVIAFAPQFSMHPDIVPDESRWRYFGDKIETWTYPDVGGMDADATTYFVFHGDNPLEARHWLRFPQGKQINHYIFKGMGHAVAALMRKRRVLPSVIGTAIERRPRKLRKLIKASTLGRRFEIYQRHLYQQEFPDVIQALAASQATNPLGDERTAP